MNDQKIILDNRNYRELIAMLFIIEQIVDNPMVGAARIIMIGFYTEDDLQR
jgi:hypothetical protein